MKNLLYILLFVPLYVIAQNDDPCYSINDYNLLTQETNPIITKNFVQGWNMFGYPCVQPIDLVEAFNSILDKIEIVRDNNGSVYLPEYGFNSIGFLERGEGYQIKMNATEYGFSFCESISLPVIEGCTDCEAVNFSWLATTDDGNCNYDSDGDSIYDSNEVLGCQDSSACNYNELATDEGECTYAETGYNCEGDKLQHQIGDFAEGGIVFYIDETGEHGLVAAQEDLEGTYEWGCYGENVDGANGTAIGTGYQNTMDIVNQNCQTEYGSITTAQAALDAQIDGHEDWYLPSRDELYEMYLIIGQGSLNVNNNIGGFSDNWYWSSSGYTYNGAWSVYFSNGLTYYYYKSYPGRARVIRAY